MSGLALNLRELQNHQGFNITFDVGVCGDKGGYCSVFYSAKGAGDVNGDGYDDIIIGYPQPNNENGVSYVIFGNNSLSAIDLSYLDSYRGFIIYGAQSLDQSGASVSGAGDVNGDGCDDLVIGAPGQNSKEATPGTTYVIYGNYSISDIYLNSLNVNQGFIINGVEYPAHPGGGNSGWSVSEAGDVDNDGLDDIIIGVPYASPDEQHHVGMAYVIYGSKTNPISINLSTLTPVQGFSIGFSNPICCSGYHVGWSVSSAGYVNQDEYADVIIGAPGASNSYIIFGNNRSEINGAIDLSSFGVSGITTGVVIEGASSSDNTGWSVSGAGDVNGDGYDDVMIGAPYAQSNAAGITYVIYGSPLQKSDDDTFPLSETISLAYIYTHYPEWGFTINGVSTVAYSGYSVSGIGDINNDSYADIFIGVPQSWPRPGDSSVSCIGPGFGYVIYGTSKPRIQYTLGDFLDSKDGFAVSDYIISENVLDDTYYNTYIGYCSQIGYFVAPGGDINKDGYKDIIIGAPTVTGFGSNVYGTSTYIIYGSESYFVTETPTHEPTLSPTTIPSQYVPWYNTEEFKYGSSLFLSLLSFTTAWLLRNKIAVYVLNNWGHEYKVYNPYVPLKENEIAIKLSLSEQIVCIAKFREYVLLDDTQDSQGIPKAFHTLMKQNLLDVQKAQSFILLQSEKNLIRNYLMLHKHIQPKQTFFCLKGYTELGYTRGTIYNLFLNSFEAEHAKASKKHVRQYDDKLESDMNKKQLNTENSNGQAVDVENPMRNSNVMEFDRIKSRSIDEVGKISNKKHCVMMSIDAMMDHEYVRLQHAEFIRFAQNINLITQGLNKQFLSITDSFETMLNFNFEYLSHTKTYIEFYPLVKTLADNLQSLVNLNYTFPEISNMALATAHMGLGHLNAALSSKSDSYMPYVASFASSAGFGARLALSSYIKEFREELAAKEQTISSYEAIKHCASVVLTYTLPDLFICAAAKTAMSTYQCANMNLWNKFSFAGNECYSVYKASQEPTTEDNITPLVIDTAVAIASYANGNGVFETITNVVAADWIGRTMFDFLQNE